MPNFPVDPPLGVPSKIQLDQIDPLTFAEAEGGGRLPQDAPSPPQVVTRIDGTAVAYSVSEALRRYVWSPVPRTYPILHVYGRQCEL